MLQKEFFYHEQTPFSSHSLGFSAVFAPCLDAGRPALRFNDKGDMMVWMAITHCNKKDKHFNKKIARGVLRQRAMELVRCKDVPELLGRAHAKAYHKAYSPLDARMYYHILRTFL